MHIKHICTNPHHFPAEPKVLSNLLTFFNVSINSWVIFFHIKLIAALTQNPWSSNTFWRCYFTLLEVRSYPSRERSRWRIPNCQCVCVCVCVCVCMLISIKSMTIPWSQGSSSLAFSGTNLFGFPELPRLLTLGNFISSDISFTISEICVTQKRPAHLFSLILGYS